MHPHHNQPVLTAGEPLESARAAMIMLHGRGGTAESILSLAPALAQPGFAYLAPQAAGNSWYPQRFLAPLEQNEPWLSSALQVIADQLEQLEQAGFPSRRILLLGFSQGACLALEFAARHPRRYGGLAGLSGGLIGPPGTAFDYPGSLEGTTVLLGCSDVDPHIPAGRVRESAAVFERMGARVTERLYPGMGHTVNEDEIEIVRGMMVAAE